jgi:hypothetical protein
MAYTKHSHSCAGAFHYSINWIGFVMESVVFPVRCIRHSMTNLLFDRTTKTYIFAPHHSMARLLLLLLLMMSLRRSLCREVQYTSTCTAVLNFSVTSSRNQAERSIVQVPTHGGTHSNSCILYILSYTGCSRLSTRVVFVRKYLLKHPLIILADPSVRAV